jgi:hypothetical protein
MNYLFMKKIKMGAVLLLTMTSFNGIAMGISETQRKKILLTDIEWETFLLDELLEGLRDIEEISDPKKRDIVLNKEIITRTRLEFVVGHINDSGELGNSSRNIRDIIVRIAQERPESRMNKKYPMLSDNLPQLTKELIVSWWSGSASNIFEMVRRVTD